MAFDRNDSADLLALKNEVNSDPISMGYDANGNTNTLLSLLNTGDSNVGGETTGETLTPRLLLANMLTTDFDANQVTDGERRYIEAFMNRPDLDEDIEAYRTKITEAFQQNSQTTTNLNSLTRRLSRAEALWGVGTVIVKADWIAARDS